MKLYASDAVHMHHRLHSAFLRKQWSSKLLRCMSRRQHCRYRNDTLNDTLKEHIGEKFGCTRLAGLNSSELSQTTENKGTISPLSQVGQVGTSATPGGGTGPITKAISQRRSHRRQWRIFECIAMVILDAVLVAVAFWMAYYLRFTVFTGTNLLTRFRDYLLGIIQEHAPNAPPPVPFSHLRPIE